MHSAFSRFRGDVEDDLEAQVAHLTKEMSALKKSLSKRGSDVYDDARDTAADFYGELRERFTDALPMVRKRARAAEQDRARPSRDGRRRRAGGRGTAGDDACPQVATCLNRRSKR